MGNRMVRQAALLCVAVSAACAGSEPTVVESVAKPPTVNGKISGFVTDATTGGPINGADVSVLADKPLAAKTNADGAFVIEGVPVGNNYRVTAKAANYATRWTTTSLASATENPVAFVVIVTSPTDAGIKGIVRTVTGAPIPNAKVTTDLTGNSYGIVVTTTTDSGGKYALAGLPGVPGGLGLNVRVLPVDIDGDSTPDYPGASQTVNTYPGAVTPADFQLSKDPNAQVQASFARMTGFLVDSATGLGLTGATVEAFEGTEKRTATSTNGVFSLEGLTANTNYRVTIGKTGFATRIVTSTPTSLGTITMPTADGTIDGLVETNGTPIKDAKVVIDLTPNGWLYVQTATSDANGKFTFTGLPAQPTGFGSPLCFYFTDKDSDGQPDYVPSCPSATTYPALKTPFVFRPQIMTISLGTANSAEGFVRDEFSRDILAGVKVYEETRPAVSVTTNAQGYYLLPGIPVNTVARIIFEKEGFTSGYVETSTSRSQQFRFDKFLNPSNGVIEGDVLNRDFSPAANADVRCDLRQTGNQWNYFKQIKTDGNGHFKLDGLPTHPDGRSITVTVRPYTAAGEPFPDTSVLSQNYVVYPGIITPASFLLSNVAVGFNFIATNGGNLGIIKPDEEIKILFNLPIVPAESNFLVRQVDFGNVLIEVTPTYSQTADFPRLVSIKPRNAVTGQPFWPDGQNIRIEWRVRSTTGQILNQSNQFQVRSGITGSAITRAVPSLDVTPDVPDATTRTFRLTWPGIPEAWGYRIYARQVGPSPRFIGRRELTNIGQSGNATYTSSIYLDTNFDGAPNQPLGAGNKIIFSVVPYDVAGIDALPQFHTEVTVQDKVPPRFYGAAQMDQAPASGAKDVRFFVRFLDQLRAKDTTHVPTITATGYTLKDWVLSADGYEATVTINGAGAGSGGNITFGGFEDGAGNKMASAQIPLFNVLPMGGATAPSTGFENGASCATMASAGWALSTVFQSSCPAQYQPSPSPVVQSRSTSPESDPTEGNCAALFGDNGSGSCGRVTWNTEIDLSTTQINGTPKRAVALQFDWMPFYSSGSSNVYAYLTDSTNQNATYNNILATNTQNYALRQWQTSGIDFSDLSQRVGTKVRFHLSAELQNAGTRGGMWVDNIRLYVR